MRIHFAISPSSPYISIKSFILHNDRDSHIQIPTMNKLHIFHPLETQPVAAAFDATAPTPGLTVDAALQSLQSSGGGLKKTAKLSSTHMDIFYGSNDRLFPKDMSVQVSMDVRREKDMQLPHRKKLAEEVQETVKAELESVFRGEKENSDATVVVRILLVSDGSSKGSRWKTGLGKAKLTLAFFLVSDKTGVVATGKQLYLTADCTPAASSELDHWEYTSAMVRSLARSACHQIEEEVTSAIVAWKQQKPTGSPTIKTELVHQEPKPLHENHDVGEDKFTLLQRLMKNLSQI